MAHEIITAETSDRLEQQALHMRVTTEINKFVDFTFLSNASQWLAVYLEVTVVSRLVDFKVENDLAANQDQSLKIESKAVCSCCAFIFLLV